MTKGSCVPGCHKTLTIEGKVFDMLPVSLVHCTDSRLKYTPSFSMKDTYLLDQKIWPEVLKLITNKVNVRTNILIKDNKKYYSDKRVSPTRRYNIC